MGARKGAGGPGRWVFIDLAHQFLDVVGPAQIPDEWLWEATRPETGRKAGGRVEPERRHSTVLLRLDGETELETLREIASQTEHFYVSVSDVYVKRNGRLSTEFEEEVFGIGVALYSPELVAFKRRFLERLQMKLAQQKAEKRKTLGEKTVPALSKASSLAIARRKSISGIADSFLALTQRHNPYNSQVGGHFSVAYIRGGEPFEKAKEMQKEVKAKLSQKGGRASFLVEHLNVVMAGGQIERIPFAKSRPLEQRAISLACLEKFLETHKDSITADMTTSDVVQQIIVPETLRHASSYVTAKMNTTEEVVEPLHSTTTGTVVAPRPPLGHVDFFVSHAWSYSFLELVSAIRNHHARHGIGIERPKRSSPDNAASTTESSLVVGNGTVRAAKADTSKTTGPERDTYYWLDIFAVNQHNLFSETELPQLCNAINASTAVVVVLYPWDQPVSLSRVWCLFEMMTAMNSEKTVTVLMPPSQHALFKVLLQTLASWGVCLRTGTYFTTLRCTSGHHLFTICGLDSNASQEQLDRDFGTIRQRLSEIDSEHAQATDPQDLKNIRKQIEVSSFLCCPVPRTGAEYHRKLTN